jgi:hypothetical protein
MPYLGWQLLFWGILISVCVQVLLGESVTFECGVEAADVSGVDVWWRKDSLNLTVGENTTNVNRKYDIQVRYLKRKVSGGG